MATEKQTKLIQTAVITALSDERCAQLRFELKSAYEDAYRAARTVGDDGASLASAAWAETLRSYLFQAGLVEEVLEALVEPARKVRPVGLVSPRNQLRPIIEAWVARDDQWTDDLIDAIAREVGPPVAATEWEPITEKHKDGTHYLLGWFEPAWFDGQNPPAAMYRVGFWHSTEKRWADYHRVLHNADSPPTHVAPLPADPREAR